MSQYNAKVLRTVLRGGSGSDITFLPDTSGRFPLSTDLLLFSSLQIVLSFGTLVQSLCGIYNTISHDFGFSIVLTWFLSLVALGRHSQGKPYFQTPCNAFMAEPLLFAPAEPVVSDMCNEAATMKWSDIDLKAKTLTIPDTKNHQPHTLPLSVFLDELLTHRYYQNPSSEYVFPGTGQGGYIVEPRKQMAKVSQMSGVNFTMHDLRRTFITVAESLDISAYAVKRLINHKMTSDVTAGYIISDVERLRKPMPVNRR